MNEPDVRRQVRVGAMVLAATAVLGALLVLKGSDRLLGRTRVFYVELPSVEGLAVGSEVQLRGFQVGHVDDIRLMEGPDPRFKVRLRVDRQVRLSRGASALVLPKGLTAAYLDLRLPRIPGPALEGGDLLPGEAGPTLSSLLTRADQTLGGLARVAERMSGEGLGGLLEGPEVRRLLTDLRGLTGEARGAVKDARGLVADGRAVVARNGPALERSLAALERDLAAAEASLQQLRAYADSHREDLEALPGTARQALAGMGRLETRVEAGLEQQGPRLLDALQALEGSLTSVEELLEVLKAKPNRVVFGKVSPQELEAARERIRVRRRAQGAEGR